MVCPYCNNESRVTNSRLQKRRNSVWRRRECQRCHAVWSTTEQIENTLAYKISAKGKLDPFSPEILLISIYETVKHRKSAAQDAKYLCGTIITKLQNNGRVIIPISDVIKTTYGVLVRFDKLSADLYAATHNMKES